MQSLYAPLSINMGLFNLLKVKSNRAMQGAAAACPQVTDMDLFICLIS